MICLIDQNGLSEIVEFFLTMNKRTENIFTIIVIANMFFNYSRNSIRNVVSTFTGFT